MDFTISQRRAIDERDCSLIISAGAGSGKTAVLTERILERICDENDDCNIDDFLIVTFTNPAAKELGDRIRKKLSQRSAQEPKNKKIINNIALLPLAKISTINSFCYEIVRENFQKLGLSASVRIADEAETGVIKQRLMNEVIDEYFEKNGDDKLFFSAYEIFASEKKDEGFVNVLLKLHDKLTSLADPDGFCADVLAQYRQVLETEEFFDTHLGKIVRDRTADKAKKSMEALDKALEMCTGYEKLEKSYVNALEKEYEFARQIFHACDKGYDAVKEVVETVKKAAFGKVSDFEDVTLQNTVKGFKEKFANELHSMLEAEYCCNREQLVLSAKDTEAVLAMLFKLLKLFEEKLTARKKELSIIEFSDAERYTLKLLVESFSPFKVTPLALDMRKSFKEIFIDEYQDVNPLQDMIFKAISRHTKEGEEYSRFMVGDIKQSIYGFRGANSDIFMSYRDSFCDIDSETKGAKRIFMSDNFRCCEAVIGFTNLIFKKLMGSYYTDGDSLNFARIENKKLDNKVQLCLFSRDKETANGLSATELEAALICKKIKEIVNNPEYTDSDNRMFSYRDIGILSKTSTVLRVYERMLSQFGIPVSSDVGESFYEKKEIILCLDILNAIDNPEKDIYLAGFMRSAACNFNDDELALIRKKYKDTSFYRAVVSFGENQADSNKELCEKCKSFVEKLRAYRDFSRGKSSDKLLWKLFVDMDLLNLCCKSDFTSDKKSTRRNLLKLYQMARDFSKTSFKGVGAFIEYIEGSLKESKVKAEREMMNDSVRLMTIHKSKGLEFPVCFVGNISGTFNKTDASEKLLFSEKAGMAVSLCDTDGITVVDGDSGLITIKTPYRKIVSGEIDEALVAEEIRVLYVALTRARDMLIMTGSFTKKIENAMTDAVIANSTNDFSGMGHYLAMLLGVLANQSVMSVYYDAADVTYNPTKTDAEAFVECHYMTSPQMYEIFQECMMTSGVSQEQKEKAAVDEGLVSRLNALCEMLPRVNAIPAKMTVSQLKKGLIDEEKNVGDVKGYSVLEGDEKEEPVPKFVCGKETADSAEKGTAMHMFMQFCNFEDCERDGCRKQAERLCAEGFISDRQCSILDYGKLELFFESDFYKRLKNSKRVYREQRFNLWAQAFEENIPDGILVQGVIDLFYENEDGSFTVVDFKTDRVFGDDAEKILIDRHRQQLMYYKRAVEEMTQSKVSKTVIYSFCLMKEIEAD